MGVILSPQSCNLIDLHLSVCCLCSINLQCSKEEKFKEIASPEFTSMILGISNEESGLGVEIVSSYESASSVSQACQKLLDLSCSFVVEVTLMYGCNCSYIMHIHTHTCSPLLSTILSYEP